MNELYIVHASTYLEKVLLVKRETTTYKIYSWVQVSFNSILNGYFITINLWIHSCYRYRQRNHLPLKSSTKQWRTKKKHTECIKSEWSAEICSCIVIVQQQYVFKHTTQYINRDLVTIHNSIVDTVNLLNSVLQLFVVSERFCICLLDPIAYLRVFAFLLVCGYESVRAQLCTIYDGLVLFFRPLVLLHNNCISRT